MERTKLRARLAEISKELHRTNMRRMRFLASGKTYAPTVDDLLEAEDDPHADEYTDYMATAANA